jgi:hypothetical protein
MAVGSLVGGGLIAVAALVHEPPIADAQAGRRVSIRDRTRNVLATARAEAAASVTVRVVFITGVAFGGCVTAVELLWQPRLADLLGENQTQGLAFGALAAASMLAVALGAGASPIAARHIGLRLGYLGAIAFAAVCIATLGAPQTPLAFALVYLIAYLGFGVAEPMHYELLNDAVGARARATLISAESLATQVGALFANLSVGALAAAQGSAAAWVLAGALLALTAALVAAPLKAAQAETSAEARRTQATPPA